MIAFGKGHRGLLDGCFLCNESAGLITLAWITDKKVLSIKLKQNGTPLAPGTAGAFEGPVQKQQHHEEIHAFPLNSWTQIKTLHSLFLLVIDETVSLHDQP